MSATSHSSSGTSRVDGEKRRRGVAAGTGGKRESATRLKCIGASVTQQDSFLVSIVLCLNTHKLEITETCSIAQVR
jgi:hypothetical protein